MLRDYEGHVAEIDFGDYADANPARSPSTAHYYYGALMVAGSPYHHQDDPYRAASAVVVTGSDREHLALIDCASPDSARYVAVALSTLDGPTLALTLGLLWSAGPRFACTWWADDQCEVTS